MQVFINDERYCTYAHRLGPDELNGLQIGGDVEITGLRARAAWRKYEL